MTCNSVYYLYITCADLDVFKGFLHCGFPYLKGVLLLFIYLCNNRFCCKIKGLRENLYITRVLLKKFLTFLHDFNFSLIPFIGVYYNDVF